MSARIPERLFRIVLACLLGGGLLVVALAAYHPNSRRITPNISLLQAADGTYQVQLRRDAWDRSYWTTITRVQELAWEPDGDRGGVLVYGRDSHGKTGWTYAYDVGPGLPELLKSWGTYSRKEFLQRGPELHLQNLRPVPPARAWSQLPRTSWPFRIW